MYKEDVLIRAINKVLANAKDKHEYFFLDMVTESLKDYYNKAEWEFIRCIASYFPRHIELDS